MCRQFDSVLNHFLAGLAQLVEQLTCNQQVGGSSPLAGTIYGGVAKWLNAADCKSAPSGSAVRICPPPFIIFNRGIVQRQNRGLQNLWCGFDSYCPCHGGCGEVVNTSDCGSDIRGFDPLQPPHNRLHQRVQFNGKTSAFQADVVGSIPITRSIIFYYSTVAQWQSYRLLTDRSQVRVLPVEPWLLGQAVKTPPFHGGNTGSSPVGVIQTEVKYRFCFFITYLLLRRVVRVGRRSTPGKCVGATSVSRVRIPHSPFQRLKWFKIILSALFILDSTL